MLRTLVVVLALANLGFYAWTQGWLDSITGVHAGGDREPERLARQVQPETVVILPSSAAGANASAPSATNTATTAVVPTPTLVCLEAGPFSNTELSAAEAAIRANAPAAGWDDVKTDKPGAWIVYMGRYADREMLAKKKEELARIKLSFEEARNSPSLEPGLVLGRYGDRAGAENELAKFNLRGVHSAKVVEISPGSSSHVLRVDKADAALAAQLMGMKNEALGKGFAPCAKPASN